jgi:hypothetical protein
MDETEVRELLREVDKFPGPHPEIPPHVLKRSRRRFTISLGATIVTVALVAGSLVGVRELLTGSPSVPDGLPGGAGTGPTGAPEPTVSPEVGGLPGLPLVGAAPSTPERGRLVLYLEGTDGLGPWTAMWVYADGRVIWGDVGGVLPAGAPTEGVTGFVEQHLTPAGVQFLQTQVLSTGLFEHDLQLVLERTGFLTIQARNGDRLVQVTWAWDGIVGDASAATPEQATALERIHGFLAHPTSWPASVWEDEDPETYVPSRYQVWLRVLPDHGDGPALRVGEREVGLLPPPAVDILRRGTPVRRATFELTTDDVRALAEALNEAGLEPGPSPMGEELLRYTLEDPFDPGNSLWVFVGPVLPHDEAVFLGPG